MTSEFRPKMSRWKILASLLIFLLCGELVLWIAPLVMGRYVHPPFNRSETRFDYKYPAIKNATAVWTTNERGARGSLYHGEPNRLLVLGSSTSASANLSNSDTWPEKLKGRLSGIHVDNLSRDGSTDLEITEILKALKADGANYDLILIMTHMALKDAEKLEPPVPFHFSEKWSRKKTFPRLPAWVFAEWIAPSMAFVSSRLPWLRRTQPAFVPNSINNRQLVLSGVARYVDIPVSLASEDSSQIIERTRQMVLGAKALAPKVAIILQPVAYDEKADGEVLRRWYSLYPVENRPGYYKSPATVAAGIRQANQMISLTAQKMGVPVLDLDEKIRPILRARGDLFYDKWHFLPEGADEAAALVSRFLIETGLAKPRE